METKAKEIRSRALIEIRPTVKRTGPPKLVPYNDRYNHIGFTSLYGYLEGAVTSIKNTTSTRGLSQFPVYSDVLYVDFDDNEEAADDFRGLIESLAYPFEMYHSGGRSIHFHIDIEPMYGINVPYSQKLWMEQKAPDADMSIYRHTGLYRLPGTYHSKHPGKKKVPLFSSKGTHVLRIENRPRAIVAPMDDEVGEVDFHNMFGKLLNTRISEGGRHQHAYKITMAGKTSGKSSEHTKRLLEMWNTDNCYPPKRDWELEKLINWVYGND